MLLFTSVYVHSVVQYLVAWEILGVEERILYNIVTKYRAMKGKQTVDMTEGADGLFWCGFCIDPM